MKRLIPVLVITLLLPQVTFAAWWNPLSWLNSPRGEFNDSAEELIVEDSGIPLKADESPLEARAIEAVKEELPSQIITVQDPALLSKINILQAENNSLREQIKLLQSQLKEISLEVQEDKSPTYQSKVKPYVEALKLKEKLRKEIEEDLKESKEELAAVQASKSRCGSVTIRSRDGTYLWSCSLIAERVPRLQEKVNDLSLKISEVTEEENEINKEINFLKLEYGI